MGTQIAFEYALGGHDVLLVARRPEAARERLAGTMRLVAELDVAAEAERRAAERRLTVVAGLAEVEGTVNVVVESVAERMDDKVAVISEAARRFPAAILASNTSSLSIGEIGATAGASERMVGTHYWNPPLLMPLVELVRGAATSSVVERIAATLREMGKRPVLVEREVPGFLWNRLQLALLREAVWLVEQGVASPAAVDEVVRDGLARRWRYTGPFATAALGGAETFERIAANLFPVLSRAERLDDLARWVDASPEEMQRAREERDRGLRRDLAAEGEPARLPPAVAGASDAGRGDGR